MKIYITGSPGSGKTTLAREISRLTGAPCVHLDEVQYESDPDNPGDNRKRTDAARDGLFREIISGESWIIEDAGRKCFRDGQKLADFVVALDIPRPVLLFRATRRWLRQKTGREKALYRADFPMLRSMWKWILEYNLPDNIPCPEKTRIFRTRRQIQDFLSGLAQ